MCTLLGCSTSDDLRSQRYDFEEPLVAQFSSHRPKNARANRFTRLIDQDSCILVKANIRAIAAATFLLGPYDHCLDYLTFLHVAIWGNFLHRCSDNIPQRSLASR